MLPLCCTIGDDLASQTVEGHCRHGSLQASYPPLHRASSNDLKAGTDDTAAIPCTSFAALSAPDYKDQTLFSMSSYDSGTWPYPWFEDVAQIEQHQPGPSSWAQPDAPTRISRVQSSIKRTSHDSLVKGESQDMASVAEKVAKRGLGASPRGLILQHESAYVHHSVSDYAIAVVDGQPAHSCEQRQLSEMASSDGARAAMEPRRCSSTTIACGVESTKLHMSDATSLGIGAWCDDMPWNFVYFLDDVQFPMLSDNTAISSLSDSELADNSTSRWAPQGVDPVLYGEPDQVWPGRVLTPQSRDLNSTSRGRCIVSNAELPQSPTTGSTRHDSLFLLPASSSTPSKSDCSQELSSCAVCAMFFDTNAELERHAILEDHRAFCCTEPGCTHTCHRRDLLNRHRRYHKASREFECRYCDDHTGFDAFKRRDSLDQHIKRSHPVDWERQRVKHCPHADCEYAKSKFKFVSGVQYRSHMSQVHGEGKKGCPVKDCKRVGKDGFKRTRDLEDHIKTKHPLELKLNCELLACSSSKSQ